MKFSLVIRTTNILIQHQIKITRADLGKSVKITEMLQFLGLKKEREEKRCSNGSKGSVGGFSGKRDKREVR